MKRWYRLAVLFAVASVALSACGSGDDTPDNECKQELCGDACVDTSLDPLHCGGCGQACPAGASCVDGSCTGASCDAGQTSCGGRCVDTSSDAANCGSCGTACGNGQVCSGGDCICPAGSVPCAGGCANLGTDPDNCGACGNACLDGDACVDGLCMETCGEGELSCDGSCVDPLTDPANCSGCGIECPVGAACLGGFCGCPFPTAMCGSLCVDVTTDVNNCGDCGTTCGDSQRCVQGQCIDGCRPGETDCGVVCAKLSEHPAHCGACGVSCNPGEACVDSVCTPAELPDLSVVGSVLSNSYEVISRTFAANDCAILEGCVGGSGTRRLLRFSTRTPNLGTADLHVGVPSTEHPQLVWSPCHGHWHFEDYASYRLLDRQGNVAATGHKQAFCLMDINRLDPNAPRTNAYYNCNNQGISQGWADTYSSGLDCQWVDVTGVPAGEYFLEVAVNPERVFAELDYTNNVARVPVTIPPDPNACEPREEICWNGLDESCTGTPDAGCAPIEGNTSCESAFTIPVGGTYQAAVGPGTSDAVASSCGGAGGKDVVFRLDLEAEQVVYLSTFGSTVSTSLAIRSGSCAGEEVACVNDSCGTQQEQWAGVLPAGTHYVVVEAHGVTAPATVSLKVQLAACTGAGRIENGVAASGNTSELENARASCNRGGAGPEESWWFTTCPGTHTVSASTCNEVTTWDTLISIAPSCSAPAVACADDDRSCGNRHATTLSGVTLEGDGLWFAIVDGYNRTDHGPYELQVSW